MLASVNYMIYSVSNIMKYIAITALILASFYIGATQLLINQVNDLKNFYQNIDTIAQNTVNNK